jgi:spore maturation protein CgeB
MQPDFVFTVCPAMVAYYRKLGIRAAHLDFGYHSSVHHPVASQEKYRGSLAIVANAYPDVLEKYPDHYRIDSLSTLVRPLLEENMRIDFYGQDWHKIQHILQHAVPPEWIHGYLPYTEANKVYSSVDIIIGLQNFQDQLTQRTYEIIGSGGFLLTNDTPEVRRVFTPGKDLITSTTPEETVELVRYYLDHPEERACIRTQGRLAIQNDTYRHRAQHMIKQLVINDVVSNDLVSPSTAGEIVFFTEHLRGKYHLYTVKTGDTLWEISQKYGITVEEIKRLNGLSTDLIYVDQFLKISERDPY